MSSCCLICYRVSEEPPDGHNPEEVGKLQTRFYRLFNRYLNGERDEVEGVPFQLDQLAGIGVLSCNQCSNLMGSFCGLYHQLKSIELRLNWKVETLKNIMACASRVTSRINCFRDFIEKAQPDDGIFAKGPEQIIKSIINSRKALIGKCSQKLVTTFPKLSLLKCRQGQQQQLENNPPQTIDSNNEIPPLDSNLTQFSSEYVSSPEIESSPVTVVDHQLSGNSTPGNGDEKYLSGSKMTTEYDGQQLTAQLSLPGVLPDHTKPSKDIDVRASSCAAAQLPISIVSEKSREDTTRLTTSFSTCLSILSPHIQESDLSHKEKAPENKIPATKPSHHKEIVPGTGTMSKYSNHVLETPTSVFHNTGNSNGNINGSANVQVNHKKVASLIIVTDDATLDLSSEGAEEEALDNAGSQQFQCGYEDHGKDHTHSTSNQQEVDIVIERGQLVLTTSSQFTMETNETLNGIVVDHTEPPEQTSNFILKGPETPTAVASNTCSPLPKVIESLQCTEERIVQQGSLSQTNQSDLEESLVMQHKKEFSAPNVASSGVIINIPGTFDVAVSKLRPTYRCVRCRKTFSTNDRLQLHSQEMHAESDSDNEVAVSSDNGESEYRNDDSASISSASSLSSKMTRPPEQDHASVKPSSNNEQKQFHFLKCDDDKHATEEKKVFFDDDRDCIENEVDSMSSTSSSDDGEICDREKFDQLQKIAKLENSHQSRSPRGKNGRQRKRHVRSIRTKFDANQIRLKCPDCNVLFENIRGLLCHRKDSESCGGLYDPATSVQVQIFEPPANKELGLNADEDDGDSKFTVRFATIDLPQAIYICGDESCGLVVYSSDDMDAHMRLHGSFQCNFCNASKPYAPNLSLHELIHEPKKTNERKKRNYFNYNCARCQFRCTSGKMYIQHHLKIHLSMELNESQCAICKTYPEIKNQKDLKSHLKTHHDLSSVRNPEDIEKCMVTNCNAYYLTTQQLEQHQSMRHCHSDQPGSSTLTSSTTPQQQPDFRCEAKNCKATFSKMIDLEHHTKYHGNFNCTFCDESFGYAPELSGHEISTHSNKETQRKLQGKTLCALHCPRAKCPFKTSSKQIYMHHHVTTHLKLNLRGLKDTTVCEICSTVFAEKSKKWHYESYHNLDNLKLGSAVVRCDQQECKAYFLTSRQLFSHRRKLHTSQRASELIYSCLVCDIDYKSEAVLNRHKQKLHKEELLYSCTVDGCQYRTDRKLGLRNHIRQLHKIQRQILKCPHCSQECFGKGSLKMHIKSHSSTPLSIQPVICETCGRRFMNKFVLQHHYKSHSGPDSWRFMCSICSKKCISKPKLDEHMRVHTQDKPFVCQICGQKYAHRHNLRIHVKSKHDKVVVTERTHTQDQPFGCDICGRKYAHRHSLRNHVHSKHANGTAEDIPMVADKIDLSATKGTKRQRTNNVELPADVNNDESESDAD